MIVEFIGCTGAGKTTLATGTAERLRKSGVPLFDRTSRGENRLASVRNVLRTPWALALWGRRLPGAEAYLGAVWRAIRQHPPAHFWMAARLLAAVRTLQDQARLARTSPAAWGILDEGALGMLHLAFLSATPVADADIARVVAIAPLPDIIVWVDAPLDELVDRTRRRADAPREIRQRSRDFLRTALGNVQRAFGVLSADPRVTPRVIPAWNPDGTEAVRVREIERVAGLVAERVASWRD